MSKRLITLAVTVSLVFAMFIPAFASADLMFVVTQNGKGLNVRDYPSTDGNKIGSIPYGGQVWVDHFLSNGWADIVWGSIGDAYVMSRYLEWYEPGPAPTAAPTSTKKTTTKFTELNNEFKNARFVTPYTVTVRPARASGWVNLRWAPNQYTELMTTYQDGYKLQVLAELKDWRQVVDPDTGLTGFIHKKFLQ